MASTSNNPCGQTSAVLSQEIKHLKSKCMEASSNIVNNIPIELQSVTAENLEEKSLCYIDGLRADIQSADTPVITDSNLLTSQFLKEINEQVLQKEQLVAYHRGLVQDVDARIIRLKNLIKIGEEAQSARRPAKLEVKLEHVQKAKERFLILKNEFHGLLHSLFPDVADDMVNLLAELMQDKLNEDSAGYMQLTTDQYDLTTMLEEIGVVVHNPYNTTEIKLAF